MAEGKLEILEQRVAECTRFVTQIQLVAFFRNSSADCATSFVTLLQSAAVGK